MIEVLRFLKEGTLSADFCFINRFWLSNGFPISKKARDLSGFLAVFHLAPTQLVVFTEDDFTARVAHSEEESCQLIEAGFEFVCDFKGKKLFRKKVSIQNLPKCHRVVWWTGGDLNPVKSGDVTCGSLFSSLRVFSQCRFKCGA